MESSNELAGARARSGQLLLLDCAVIRTEAKAACRRFFGQARFVALAAAVEFEVALAISGIREFAVAAECWVALSALGYLWNSVVLELAEV